MIYLIGMGLWDEKDLSIRGLEIAKKADRVFLENYTSSLMGLDTGDLEELVQKPIEPLSREDMENDPRFLKDAVNHNIAILVGGDPLVATTHHDLILRAREAGINVRVIHNASIISAIAETGLHIYKFGRTVTIPFWTENFKPTSFFKHILENISSGLHTLVLLDIDKKNNRYMTANEGLKRIQELDNERKIKTAIVVARLGSDSPLIRYGTVEALINQDFGPPLHSIVVPGELHVLEKDYLESL